MEFEWDNIKNEFNKEKHKKQFQQNVIGKRLGNWLSKGKK